MVLLFQWVADDQFEPLHLKELLWMLINAFSFETEGDNAAGESVFLESADEQWGIIVSAAKCIGNQNQAILNIYKAI